MAMTTFFILLLEITVFTAVNLPKLTNLVRDDLFSGINISQKFYSFHFAKVSKFLPQATKIFRCGTHLAYLNNCSIKSIINELFRGIFYVNESIVLRKKRQKY